MNMHSVTNFIWPYLHQFFDNSHSLNGYGKPLKRPFDQYQSNLEAISIGQDIRQINWSLLRTPLEPGVWVKKELYKPEQSWVYNTTLTHIYMSH